MPNNLSADNQNQVNEEVQEEEGEEREANSVNNVQGMEVAMYLSTACVNIQI